MSSTIQPSDQPAEARTLEHQTLEAVTGGSTVTPRCTGNDQIMQTLTSLSSTLTNLGNTTNNGSLTMSEVMMFGMLMSQRNQVNVFVRRPFW